MTPALQRTFAGPSLRRAALIASVVGTVLNMINQGDVVASGGDPALWKVMLTYIVPFCSACCGAYGVHRSLEARQNGLMAVAMSGNARVGLYRSESGGAAERSS